MFGKSNDNQTNDGANDGKENAKETNDGKENDKEVKIDREAIKAEKKKKIKEARKVASKAIPLSQMKPNSDMLDAGFNTSEIYMTKKEKEVAAEAKKKAEKKAKKSE